MVHPGNYQQTAAASVRQEKVGKLRRDRFLIHTRFQPGGVATVIDSQPFQTVFDAGRPGKPLKRLWPFLTNPDTRLKPGVNETKTPLV
jgi:hypothetical protein